MWKNNEVYHSLSYTLRKTLNSCQVAYMENDILNFGEVIFFIKTDSGCFALLKRMRCLPDGLFHDQVGWRSCNGHIR